MKLQFKQGVYGFIYESIHGDITEILNNPITESEVEFFNKYSGDTVMFTDLDTIIELFSLDDEKDPEYINQYWGEILEVVL